MGERKGLENGNTSSETEGPERDGNSRDCKCMGGMTSEGGMMQVEAASGGAWAKALP